MSAFETQQLLTTRLWVARLGDVDVRRWWQTDEILGSEGAYVGPRVLPKTHATGRARIAFAVARHACWERYPDRAALHLFQLDPETEDRFDAYLVEMLDQFDFWSAMMERLEVVKKAADTETVLLNSGLAQPEDIELVSTLPLGPDNRSLLIAPGNSAEQTLRRLAAGFIQSTEGSLAVPYFKGEG